MLLCRKGSSTILLVSSQKENSVVITIYQKGISLNKSAMKEVEKRLERNPLLPKWDVLIRPV